MTTPFSDPNTDLQLLAENLWAYLKPKVQAMQSSNLSYYRAQVVAPAGRGKTISIQRPFDQTTQSLPFVSSAGDLAPGDQVTVLVLGDPSNAIVLGTGTLSNL